ncbi:hypothetical protein Pmar_PMAR004503 [Perkinsus marinus ATCC 50983]|uniref:Uncharacterized protein n=1 Tax=Perkinsus marinus (strain ATCC 50983 / TXsc) TaxID=423536 RepID=C5LZU6_PERM5|nr:hypothetical protein Pmar_PMAR004503 [Perkinsus marinus ATCC 50983]EEQ97764.1 hypothetical protein Pmar_PMAR004503 [Perkinsus marinus ATCC 50983]|eukprot:XP_002765047.1 hypothetical protein Pmar_PMAR004503 [Perkinsus marinus ATCC 50983]
MFYSGAEVFSTHHTSRLEHVPAGFRILFHEAEVCLTRVAALLQPLLSEICTIDAATTGGAVKVGLYDLRLVPELEKHVYKSSSEAGLNVKAVEVVADPSGQLSCGLRYSRYGFRTVEPGDLEGVGNFGQRRRSPSYEDGRGHLEIDLHKAIHIAGYDVYMIDYVYMPYDVRQKESSTYVFVNVKEAVMIEPLYGIFEESVREPPPALQLKPTPDSTEIVPQSPTAFLPKNNGVFPTPKVLLEPGSILVAPSSDEDVVSHDGTDRSSSQEEEACRADGQASTHAEEQCLSTAMMMVDHCLGVE